MRYDNRVEVLKICVDPSLGELRFRVNQYTDVRGKRSANVADDHETILRAVGNRLIDTRVGRCVEALNAVARRLAANYPDKRRRVVSTDVDIVTTV